MKIYRHCFTVKAPLDRVATFYGNIKVIKKLTPPPLMVQFHEAQPLAEGSRVDFTIWVGPFPIRWLAIHEAVNLPTSFIDHQVIGPFTTWQHHHQLERVDVNVTKVVDEVSVEFKGLVSHLMWIGLPLVFTYRAWITRHLLE
jgi:ligand-binding SRPBCC domain-containing protein